MENSQTYAGDISPQEAWNILKDDPRAILVDCRTDAEFNFVGMCDLSALNKEPATIQWKIFPSMQQNPAFVDQVKMAQPHAASPVLFLCRSGQRSRDAAIALTEVGYLQCFNITGGFEGDCDGAQHRGMVNGWKCANLPWIQR